MKVEDRVIVHRQSQPDKRDKLAIGKIVGETKTSWRIKYGDGLGTPIELFRKKDLYLRGSELKDSCYRISPWNDDEWKDYQRELLKRIIIHRFDTLDWDALLVDDLVIIHQQIMDAQKKAKIVLDLLTE